MKDLQNALTQLRAGNFTCVLCKGDEIYTDSRRGVKPLLEFLNSGKDFQGFSAADKVVGKAAAHLYCLLKVSALHAGIISTPAKTVLEKGGITVTFDKEVPAIENRTKTGPCPMESAVWDIADHHEAHTAILRTLEKLQS